MMMLGLYNLELYSIDLRAICDKRAHCVGILR